MISKRSKGRLLEREFFKILESEGYKCIITQGHGFSDQDFYGLFDIIAVRNSDVLFVQVKSNSARCFRKECDWFKAFLPSNSSILLAIKWDAGKRKGKIGWERVIV